jgi:hypothetical protein
MPFLCLFALLFGGGAAYVLARSLKLSRLQTGSLVVGGWFTNIGSIGALVVFILLGEEAFALVPVYKLFEEFSYYAFGFPMARSFAAEPGATTVTTRERFQRIVRDPFVLITTGSIITGFILNASGATRPDLYGLVNSVLIPVASTLLLVSIGMTMNVTSVRRNIVPNIGIVGIKHLLVPAFTTVLAALIGFGSIAGGMPLRVALVLSAMPAGFVSIVVTTLYDLDVDLANSNWLLSNAALVVVVPILALLVGII